MEAPAELQKDLQKDLKKDLQTQHRPRPSVAVSPPALGRRVVMALSVGLYLAFCGLVILNALARPIADWDMLAYTAVIVERQGETDPVRLHAKAYALVKASVTDAQWHELTTLGHYRMVQARDADAFVSMLPMYEVKGGYIRLVEAASRLIGPVAGMRMISFAAMLGLMGTLFWAFWRLGQLHLIGLMTPVMNTLRFPDLASIATPDPVVAFLATAAACLILVAGRTRPPAPALLLLVAAVLFRPDMLVATTGLPLALVAGCVLAAMLKGQSLSAACVHALRAVGPWPWAAALGGFAAYMLAKADVTHPGWFAHFWFSIHEQKDTMAGFQPAFDLKIYLSAVARATMRLLREQTWPWIMLSLMLCGLIWARLRDFGPVLLGLMIFVLGIWASRTLVFPLPDSRIAAPVVLIAILIAVAFAARPSPRSSQRLPEP